VASIDIGQQTYHSWQEASERRVDLGGIPIGELMTGPHRHRIHFSSEITTERLEEAGRIAGRLVRRQQALDGEVEVQVEQRSPGIHTVTIRVANTSLFADEKCTDRDAALMQSLVSTHVVLGICDGRFISATDPPPELKELASTCRNVGCWPVLVGNPATSDAMLVSPIILYDYPQIAPESPGDLYDGCEIDEILTLRIMTLTDEEKRQAMAADPRVADLMARTQSLAREQLMNLHGALRGVGPAMESSYG
jgi:hydrogenase maturation protease